ncbi:hypothetical protein GCM10010918_34840 [Paenibacillus radicis (ex Gao et al. 2016)]|uniref:Uncharacterized protein n=1 Tax=Paenibacillus radicis (ex Gao et al. 2016) TaxID=1737354 RepID=A0A917HDL2_9BACL|nr:hypothetical protein GCM10010918_34840 [Paenibacillus radicis (ex Gao et al. 2016)]
MKYDCFTEIHPMLTEYVPATIWFPRFLAEIRLFYSINNDTDYKPISTAIQNKQCA